MRSFTEWIFFRFGWVERDQILARLDRSIRKLQKEKAKSDRELIESRAYLKKAEEEVVRAVQKSTQAVMRAEGLNRKLDEALSASQAALKTANEIVVPGLVAANATFHAAYEAQTSQLIQRGINTRVNATEE